MDSRKENQQADQQCLSEVDSNLGLCYELIFPYLELSDLVSVADSTKLMKISAEQIFFRKYRNKQILIREQKISRYYWEKYEKVLVREGLVHLKDTKTCFGNLRCFGNQISDLFIQYSRCPHKQFLNPFFDCYINEYCANHLTKLGIAFKGDLFNNFTKPFPNVEDFFFRSFDLNGQKIKLSNWLPKLRSLRIADCSPFFLLQTLYLVFRIWNI